MFKPIEYIGHIYYLILPVMVGAILNMVFIKLPVLKRLRVPMDGGKILKDGGRLFGDNKTWKGFIGMIVLTALSALFCWYGKFPVNLLHGAWLGFAYVLFELPNSFIKRRLNKKPGTNGGAVQTFFDQADSVFGCILLYPFIHPLNLTEAVCILTVATATHYIFNVLLFHMKLRNQKG